MSKTVLITGASSGIGKAAARLFAARGWNVVATMRDPGKDTGLGKLDNVLVTRLDVEDGPSIGKALAAGLERFGRIDVLINNAGYGQFGLFETVSPQKVRQQFEVNVFGVMEVTRALLPHMRANKGGIIINVSSGAGLFTLPMISLYCASKFALEGFSEALSYELAPQHIIVKLVEPHGGVTGTSFGERQAADRAMALDPSLSDYQPFVAKTDAAFAAMGAARVQSSDDVAEVLFTAATDGSDQLRYLSGDDARGFIKAWDRLPNADYVAFMRAKFAPKG